MTSQSTNAGKEIDRDQFNPSDIVIGEDIVTIDNYFMYGCTAFNGTITFSNNNPRLTYIAMGFMNGCVKFEGELNFPSSLKFIGSSFMYGCSKFNSSLNLSEILVIGDDFLGECKAFAQKIVLPENLQYIGSSFM
ncbi:MAG: leucine-rich repeat domain-containing protein [Mycoplasmoidaceae bacterium]|nr:leucine-rich repeat domain-containing protein [Mycoplasmoidaceae bacterium]